MLAGPLRLGTYKSHAALRVYPLARGYIITTWHFPACLLVMIMFKFGQLGLNIPSRGGIQDVRRLKALEIFIRFQHSARHSSDEHRLILETHSKSSHVHPESRECAFDCTVYADVCAMLPGQSIHHGFTHIHQHFMPITLNELGGFLCWVNVDFDSKFSGCTYHVFSMIVADC